MKAAQKKKVSTRKIYAQWDRIAPIRILQILSGKDITFDQVLYPFIRDSVLMTHGKIILDAGCGVGALSNRISDYARHVTGIDPSGYSIKVAKENFNKSNVTYANMSIEEFARENISDQEKFDCVIANMVLMDTLDLESFLSSSHYLIKENGSFIFTITHPRYWPLYAGYSEEPWFDYSKEIIIEDDFRISNDTNAGLRSVHIHRPIESYKDTIKKCGFYEAKFFELMPSSEIQEMYPHRWSWPRYLGGICFA